MYCQPSNTPFSPLSHVISHTSWAAEEVKRMAEMKVLDKKRLDEEASMVQTFTHILINNPGFLNSSFL